MKSLRPPRPKKRLKFNLETESNNPKAAKRYSDDSTNHDAAKRYKYLST